MTFIEQLEQQIADKKISVLNSEINLEWMRKKKAQISLIDKPNQQQRDLLKTLEEDIPTAEEQQQAAQFVLERYEKKAKDERANLETAASS